MSLESVRESLKKFGADTRILEFESSSATVDLAAEDLHCRPEEICKTMAFDVDGRTVVIGMAGTARIDNHKYKGFFHAKAKMLKGDEVVQRTSHPIGGVCPFGLSEGVEVYLDESLKKFEKVYPACGSANSAICVTIDELQEYSGCHNWIDVTKMPEEEQ